MPEIGPTLREARMRARIDISEIESETKIRAKYLRALENEEWNLLPGPTYVKTFLRTYAEALGLDAKLLVEEYKLRHERLSDHELARPIGPTRATSGGRGRGPTPPVLPRSYLVAGVLLALCVVIFILSRVGGKDHKSSSTPATAGTPATTTTAARTTAKPAATTKRKAKPASKLIRLKIVPTGTVYACLAAKGQPGARINGATLTPSTPPKTFKSSRFRLVLGNENAELRVNGKRKAFPKDAVTTSGVFVQITKKGLSALPKALRPGCTG
ncbi:helix-turn-helix domain-containing protein [Paraconexibacter antarcticus]|nr:helix-turn-helix domain-containing protein [Paraconexibacter antarcticus]